MFDLKSMNNQILEKQKSEKSSSGKEKSQKSSNNKSVKSKRKYELSSDGESHLLSGSSSMFSGITGKSGTSMTS